MNPCGASINVPQPRPCLPRARGFFSVRAISAMQAGYGETQIEPARQGRAAQASGEKEKNESGEGNTEARVQTGVPARGRSPASQDAGHAQTGGESAPCAAHL